MIKVVKRMLKLPNQMPDKVHEAKIWLRQARRRVAAVKQGTYPYDEFIEDFMQEPPDLVYPDFRGTKVVGTSRASDLPASLTQLPCATLLCARGEIQSSGTLPSRTAGESDYMQPYAM